MTGSGDGVGMGWCCEDGVEEGWGRLGSSWSESESSRQSFGVIFGRLDAETKTLRVMFEATLNNF